MAATAVRFYGWCAAALASSLVRAALSRRCWLCASWSSRASSSFPNVVGTCAPLVQATDRLLLRKWALIESVNSDLSDDLSDGLKNVRKIEPTRHHRPSHFLVHLLGGLIA
jgi:hypothetical protein